MPNGITVKQAIETELEGKTEFTVDDTIKCIKHIAGGLDNMARKIDKVDKIEIRIKWHERIFSAVYTITIGTVIAWWKSNNGER